MGWSRPVCAKLWGMTVDRLGLIEQGYTCPQPEDYVKIFVSTLMTPTELILGKEEHNE